jgi:A/G-specific adenine glycosylase
VLGIDGDPDRGPTRARFWESAKRLVEEGDPGTINQAIMELGALVCLPRAPRCEVCPAAADCVARRGGLIGRLPRTSERRDTVSVTCAVVLLECAGRILLRRRGAHELLPGLWDLPGTFAGDDGDRGASLEDVVASLPFEIGACVRLGTIRHHVTHRRITLEVHASSAARSRPARTPIAGEIRWVPPREAASMALSAPARKILAKWGASLDTPESAPVTSSL